MSVTAMPIPLGPYDLFEEIGRGGMGVVWRGARRGEAAEVAVKVLQRVGDTEAEFVAAFKQEARAVGRLHHPHIVSVVDYGLLPASVERASENALVTGQPYLVMEWLGGGALDQAHAAPASWSELSRLLLQTLDALAHAHARGVLHRDIKTSNIVRGADGSPRLIDFGIARLDNPTASQESVAGTVSYMAPEQIEVSRLREQGPWTDLYALGCLAFELASGRLPFPGDSFVAVILGHLEHAPPALEPRFAVPVRFEAWVRCLLEKSPRARFRCAADAALALQQLGADFEPASAWAPTLPPAAADAVGVPEAFMTTLGAMLDVYPASLPVAAPPWLAASGREPAAQDSATADHSDVAGKSAVAWPRPRMPLTWRRDADAAGPPTGIGMVGLRTVPMVGRDGERDLIWQALLRAVQQGAPELVVLEGDAGCGKSRIAEWMLQRAVELGAVTGLTAWHGPTVSELGGPTGMMARHLSCIGLGWDDLKKQVGHVLAPLGATPAQVQAMAEVLRGVSHDEVSAAAPVSVQGSFTSEAERAVAIEATLALLAQERPLFVWLDDVQWGPDALRLMRRLVEEGRGPMLLVATVRSEALPARRAEATSMRALEELAGVTSLEVPPLPSAASHQLVEATLGLDIATARRVVALSAGNPLFAVELVADLVQRRLLHLTVDGHYAAHGASPDDVVTLADNLPELWRRRTERLIAGVAGPPCPQHPTPGCACPRDALELAAVLGQEVALELWNAVCDEAGVARAPALLEALLEQELAVEVAGGFRFTHGLLRESLEREASEREALQGHHRACARTLAAPATLDADQLARVAEHALGAGDAAWSVRATVAAALEALRRGQQTRVARLVTRLEALASTHPSIATEQGRVELSYLQAESLRESDPARALGLLEQAEKDAEAAGAELLLARVKRALYQHLHRRVGARRVAHLVNDAVLLFEKHGSHAEAAGCLHVASRDALERFDVQEAGAMLTQMQRLAEKSQDPLTMAECLDRSSDLLRQEGDTNRALAANAQAVAGFEALGCLAHAANALNARAEILWLNAKNLDAAAATVTDAIARHEALGSRRLAYFPRYNLAAIELQRGQVEVARPIVEWLDLHTDPLGYQVVRPLVHVMQAMVAADEDDWANWDHHLASALTMTDLEESLVEEDLLLWRAAVHLAEDRGHPKRAKPARAQAEAIAARLAGK